MPTTLLNLPDPVECQIVKKLNRFVVIIKVNGREERAWINNTGRLEEFMVPGTLAYCHPHDGKATGYRLFAMVEQDGLGALIDTQYQMRCFEAAIEQARLPWLEGWKWESRNPRLGDSVLDYYLTKEVDGGRAEDKEGNEAYLEVKSAVLRVGNMASYPDCPTLRGQRHIRELTGYAERGGKAIICFVSALPGVAGFIPYGQGDPEIPILLGKAKKAGVEIRAVSMHYDAERKAVVLDEGDLWVKLE